MKRCPFCAEEIQDAAVVCRWCGRELAPAPEGTRRDVAARRPEQSLWRGRPALRSHAGKLAPALLLLLGAGAIGLVEPGLWFPAAAAAVGALVLLALALVGVLRFRYEVTTERALTHEGLVSRSSSEIQLDDVRNVQQTRTVTERLLGLGTVSLSTAGQSGMEITFRSIADADEVVRLVNEHNE